MKVAELEGGMLDYWVGKAAGVPVLLMGGNCISAERLTAFQPSAVWAHAGGLIEREKIATWFTQGQWEASYGDPVRAIEVTGPDASGPTLLIAVMRAYVASKFGDDVEDAPHKAG